MLMIFAQQKQTKNSSDIPNVRSLNRNWMEVAQRKKEEL